MKKIYIPFLIITLITCLGIFNSCRRDVGPAAVTGDVISYTQSFDSIQAAINQGWVLKNNSRPLGIASWFSGVFGNFPGAFNSYTGADYIFASSFNAADPAPGGETTVSNWLITPARPVKNGDVLSFYTRGYKNPATYPDRLEVRLNTNGSTEVGNDSSTVGDFTKLVLSINPNLTATGYPASWTQYSYTVSGLVTPKSSARFAFRYYRPRRDMVPSTGIGIDEVTFTSVK